MNRPSLLAFGEIIWDIYPDKACIGGTALNFAAHSVICGIATTLLSAVGHDRLGDDALQYTQRIGINSSFIQQNKFDTGKCIVSLDDAGIPQYLIKSDTAYDHIAPPHASFSVNEYDVLYFGTLAQRSERSRGTLYKLVENGCFREIFCDVNLREGCYTHETIEYCLKNATILKLSDSEADIIAGELLNVSGGSLEIMQALAERYKQLKIIIITLGENGSDALDTQNGTFIHTPAVNTAIVSTVGAGDCFSASFLAKYLMRNQLSGALAFATERAAYVVSQKDAVPDSWLSSESGQ